MLTRLLTGLIFAVLALTNPAQAGEPVAGEAQPQADFTEQPTEIPAAKTAPRTLKFAGLTWWVKASRDGLAGPGPNYFSADPQDVFVDEQGRLHLTISHRDGKWFSTEVVTQATTGYGQYEFHLVGPVDGLDPNAVLGLFTWDSHTWKTDANSEIDIELTRWADADAPNLNYSVHPGWGPDTESGKHPERTTLFDMALDGDESTHVINWTPTRVTNSSYQGAGLDPEKLIYSWSFDDTNPPRITNNEQGDTSDPIVIPRPSTTTHTRINLWLIDTDGDNQADPPTDGQPIQVIISGFRFIPIHQAQTRPAQAGE